MKKNSDTIHWNRSFLLFSCFLQALYGVLSMCFAVVLNTLANAAGGKGDFRSAGILALLFGTLYPASRALPTA